MPATEATNVKTAGATGADEVRQLARTFQYDRYVAALLLPRRHREALIVLAAFAAELQRIPFAVTEPMMAAVRLQWWRDELMTAAAPGAKARRSGHQLCDALVGVALRCALPFGLLQGMIDAAGTELDATPLAEAAETRQVLVKFEGALFELAGRVLSADAPRELWQQAAIAYGGAWLAAEHPRREAVGAQTYVSQACGDAQQAFVTPANEALAALRAGRAELDAGARGALLPLATVAPLLRGVATQVQHTDATNGLMSDFTRARLILWTYWRGRI